jgi:site-specific recombinase XerD
MKEILNQWRDYLILCNKSHHTVRNYLSDADQYFDCATEKGFDPLKVDRVTARLYLEFLAGKYTNKATIMRKRDTVNMLYRFMVDDKIVSQNPFRLFDRMKVNKEHPKFLTQDQAAHLLDTVAINPELEESIYGAFKTNRVGEGEFLAIRDRALLELMYGTGTRCQETADLNWNCIDWRAGFVRVENGKGGKDRIIPITEKALTALWDYGKAFREHFKTEPKGTTPVFMSRRNVRITTRSIQRAVKLRLALAGIETDIAGHGLRHSFATHLMQRGLGMVELAEMLGHKNLSTTQIYVHLSQVDVFAAYDRGHPRA